MSMLFWEDGMEECMGVYIEYVFFLNIYVEYNFLVLRIDENTKLPKVLFMHNSKC